MSRSPIKGYGRCTNGIDELTDVLSKAASLIDPAMWVEFLDLRIGLDLSHSKVSGPVIVNTFSAWKWSRMPGCLHLTGEYGIFQETGNQTLISDVRSARNSSHPTNFFHLRGSQLHQTSTLQILLQLFLLIYTLGKLCHGLVASYRSTGARRSGMSHSWCALCSLDFCWRGSGARKTHHTERLCLMTVKTARDKAVTANWPSWPEVGQTHTGSSWAGTFPSGQSEQSALPLNQKNCKVLSPVHVKDWFLRGLLVLAFMWL